MIKRFFLGAVAALVLTGFVAQAAPVSHNGHPTMQGGKGLWGG